MTTFKIYKLHFTSPLHIGDAREDYGSSRQTIDSDTMYAALTSCLAKLGRTIPEDGFLGCTISSLFPFYQKSPSENAVLFLPKPLKQKLPNISVEHRKRLKKVQWLDASSFSDVLNGHPLFENESELSYAQGKYYSKDRIDTEFMYSQVSQRVTVSWDFIKPTTPFYMDRIWFHDYSGLYFMVEGDDNTIKPALDLLQEEGIGTDRNVGNGHFVYEEDELSLNLPESAEFSMSLSSFIPDSRSQLADMMDSDEVAYELHRCGGWITTAPYNSLRKNVIHTFLPGSVFRYDSSDQHILGRIIDLNPGIQFDRKVDHPVWRCGKSIFVPIKF